MKRFASTIIGLTMALAPVATFARYASTVDVDNDLHISDRVKDGSIQADVARIQLYDASKPTQTDGHFQAYLANMNVMEFICNSASALKGLSTDGCGSPTVGHTRL